MGGCRWSLFVARESDTGEYADLTMNESEIIQRVQAEIGKLQRVLDLLLDHSGASKEVQRPGRPQESGRPTTSFVPKTSSPKRRVMSEAGRARIAAAQKQRWAAQKAAPPSRTSDKQTTGKRARKTAEPIQKMVLTTKKKSVDGRPRIGSGQSASATPAPNHAASKKARTRTGATKPRATKVASTKTSARRAVATKTARPATKTPAKRAATAAK